MSSESDEQGTIEIVAAETEEVEAVIGPRRISGLIYHSAQAESDSRAARVYGKTAQPRGK